MEFFTNGKMVERDIGAMLTNLEEAHKWNEIAKQAYSAQDYQ